MHEFMRIPAGVAGCRGAYRSLLDASAAMAPAGRHTTPTTCIPRWPCGALPAELQQMGGDERAKVLKECGLSASEVEDVETMLSGARRAEKGIAKGYMGCCERGRSPGSLPAGGPEGIAGAACRRRLKAGPEVQGGAETMLAGPAGGRGMQCLRHAKELRGTTGPNAV